MMKFLVILFLLCAFQASLADEPGYAVNLIPAELKEGMYAVIRNKEVRLEIYGRNSSSYFYRQAITILSPKAKGYAAIQVGYDNLRSIKSLKAVVYDALGNEVKKLKASDIRDESQYDGFSLLSDNRSRSADLSQATYPYTVEVEFEIQNKFLYSGPDFYVYRDDEVSTQELSYTIRFPEDLKPRCKLFKVPEPVMAKSPDGRSQMSWTFKNILPQKFERHSVEAVRLIPNIRVAPNEFEYGGYAGRMDSWKEYGLWQARLNAGREELPDATRLKVKEMVKTAGTTEDQVRVLYEYLQNKTRYVSIQLGIGGLQPFEARSVDATGYGDCKALSNYMVSLLKEAGIKGYYTTIMAGEDETAVDPDLPSHQFNHVIVAVPNGADTLWLECTSQTKPFDWMGSFTGDRYAMMVTEQGGVLVKTPSYPTDLNLQIRKADVALDVSGNATAKVITRYEGLQSENDRLDFIINMAADEQKKWIQKTTQIPMFEVGKFSFRQRKSKIPATEVEVEYTLNRLATISGKRIFITPNLMNRSTYIPEKLAERKTKVVMRKSYVDIDTIRYQLPEEIYPEFLPPPVQIKSPFGEYESRYAVDQGKLTYTRRIKILKGEFPAESYPELIEFYRQINKADQLKMVFMKKT